MSGSQYEGHNGRSGMVVAEAGKAMPGAVIPASQGTMIEQARAIAEVRAAVMIAMDRPRDRAAAISEMREVCKIPALAERAFFRVPRGGTTATGETIHLARELARCWGNVDYGVKELVRNDSKGESELLAFAWDLQTNTRSEIVFVVPHVKGRENRRLTGTQEIYENNASFAGRRLREAIFSILPVWFKDEAAELCHRTLESGGEIPLVRRLADLRSAFESMGVTVAMLERKRARKIDEFTAEDVASLGIVYKSLRREEVTIADEFPADAATAKAAKPVDKLEAIETAAAGTKPASGSADLDWIMKAIADTKAAEIDALMKSKAVLKIVSQIDDAGREKIAAAVDAKTRNLAPASDHD